MYNPQKLNTRFPILPCEHDSRQKGGHIVMRHPPTFDSTTERGNTNDSNHYIHLGLINSKA